MPPPGYGVDGDILNPLVEESGVILEMNTRNKNKK
jgi:hypothetical protein